MQGSSSALPVAEGERGGKSFRGRGRGARGRGRMGAGRGEGGNGDLAKITISVDAGGAVVVAIRALQAQQRRERDVESDRMRQERAGKRAEEKKEREARKADAAYTHARSAALAVAKEDGNMNLGKALDCASKFVMHAQRCVDAKSERMEQMGLRAEVERAGTGAQTEIDTDLVVQLCAEIQEINKHVRQVLGAILRHQGGDEMV